MTTILYLLRHGEYQDPNNILPVRLPGFPLSQSGVKQIKSTAQYLKDKNLKAIFSSPILRCRQSARIIGKVLNIQPQFSKLIIETKTPFQGTKLSDYYSKKIVVYKHPYHIRNHGETIKEIFKRMKKFIVKILTKYVHQNILLVSHGDPLMITIYGIVEKNLDKYFQKTKRYIPKGGLAKMEFRGEKLFSFEEINY